MRPQSAAMMTLLFCSALAWGQANRVPQITPEAQAAADGILAMADVDPASRFNQILAAKEMDQNALFALASHKPGLVEQILIPPYTLALAYIGTMPAPEIHRVRRGETIIRTVRDMGKGEERRAADRLAEELGLGSKKLEAIRIGPLENRIIRVEVTTSGKPRTVEMAWPSTPERDDKSRDALSKVFGARPTQSSLGVGAPLPLVDGSFENPESLGQDWKIENGPDLGGGTPTAEVNLDEKVSIDGTHSLRFYATMRTRQFLMVSQQITVASGMPLVARAMLKTENIRKEFQQTPSDLWLEMSFLDIAGNPVGAPTRAVGALETHTWQALEVTGTAPDDAAYVRIAVMSALSGTAWFDGVTLQIGE